MSSNPSRPLLTAHSVFLRCVVMSMAMASTTFGSFRDMLLGDENFRFRFADRNLDIRRDTGKLLRAQVASRYRIGEVPELTASSFSREYSGMSFWRPMENKQTLRGDFAGADGDALEES